MQDYIYATSSIKIGDCRLVTRAMWYVGLHSVAIKWPPPVYLLNEDYDNDEWIQVWGGLPVSAEDHDFYDQILEYDKD